MLSFSYVNLEEDSLQAVKIHQMLCSASFDKEGPKGERRTGMAAYVEVEPYMELATP